MASTRTPLPLEWDLIFVIVWTVIFMISIGRSVRNLERRLEWKRWCRKPGYSFLGSKLPPDFPTQLVEEFFGSGKVRNCVLNEQNPRRKVGFDLDLTPDFKTRKWVTLVAVEGLITEEKPWPYPRDATALQGGGWIILRPADSLLRRKDGFFRFLDAIPPRQRLLEAGTVLALWEAVEQIMPRWIRRT